MIQIFRNLNLRKLSKFGSFFLFALIIFGCGSNDEKVEEASLSEEEKIEMIQTELSTLILGKSGSFMVDSVSITSTDWLIKLYGDNTLFWYDGNSLSKEGKGILNFLSKAYYYGLDTNLYHVSTIRALIKKSTQEDDFKVKAKMIALTDILINDGAFLFSTHISSGFIDTAKMEIAWKRDSVKMDMAKLLKEKKDSTFFNEVLKTQPRYFEYQYLLAGLKNFLDEHPKLSDTRMEFADIKKDSVNCGKQVRERLVELGYLPDSLKNVDTSAVSALKKFQTIHSLDVDGKIGKFTLQMLSESEMDRYRRAALALEKWRWKRRGKEFQVRLNIPSYEVNVIRNDSIIYANRAITGATATPTPELKAKIKWITLFPFWHVPHSISSTEILWAAQRDTSYIRKNNYQIFRKNDVVNVADINWKKLSKDNFPYRVRQNGGPGNSLGLIVFHFPNKHDVYMHDSPAKYLFKRSTRAFSHGCMRLNEPFRLGEIIMKNEKPKDTITADTLKVWSLNGEGERRINLKYYVPVEVDYITVTGDSLNQIWFHLDVYRRDEKFYPLIYPKSAKNTDNKKVM